MTSTIQTFNRDVRQLSDTEIQAVAGGFAFLLVGGPSAIQVRPVVKGPSHPTPTFNSGDGKCGTNHNGV